jgi:DNA-binding response OmpR family regulator
MGDAANLHLDGAFVLLLSDDSLSWSLLRLVLEKVGCKLSSVGSAAALRARVAQQLPDLLLLDTLAPTDELFGLCEEIKRSLVSASLPVIFISSSQDPGAKVRCFDCGADDYVTKPFHPSELAARLEQHLRRSRRQQSLEREKAELVRRIDLHTSDPAYQLPLELMGEALEGQTLDGRYRLLKRLGSGGFGVVYEAEHLALKRRVAVKVVRSLHPQKAQSQIERFQREGLSATLVKHPNAVAVLDAGVARGRFPYLVMELLLGHTLADEQRRCPLLPVLRSLQIIEPVCEVLALAHATGIIHRDIKPENIFLHRAGEREVVKVLDFGIASLRGPEFEALPALTVPDLMLGTPHYMAPERLLGKEFDGRADIYGIAVTHYQMLCGRLPFPTVDANQITSILNQLSQPPTPPEQYRPDIPGPVASLLLAGLEKDPERRPDAREYKHRIQQYLQKSGD